MGQRFLRLLQDLVLPREQLQAEILPLALVHERLFVRRSVELVLVDYSDAILLRGHCYPMPKTKRTPELAGRAYIEPREGGQQPNCRRARFRCAAKGRGRALPSGRAHTPSAAAGAGAALVSASCIRRMYPPHGGRRDYCGCSTALIASALAVDAGACAGKRMSRSEISCIRASPAPVLREST